MAEKYPDFFPGWKTVRKIGTGSFGAVYEINRTLPNGIVEKAALKAVSIPQNDSDIEELYSSGYDDETITAHFQTYLAEIVSEYTLMSEIKGHTNVVYCDDIHYVQHDKGFGWDIYIKMELLTPLLKMKWDGTPEELAIRLGKDIASALVVCKNKNIIHRDIKPQNIFVSNTGDFKLGDFGIAKTVEKTTGGTKVGTFSYMAPEVYNNLPYGASSDLYSLGLVMYWILNERRAPFTPLPPRVPDVKDHEQARRRRFGGEPIPAPLHGSKELARIVIKACQFQPEDRYETPEDLLEDLNALGTEAKPDVVSTPPQKKLPPEEDGHSADGYQGDNGSDQDGQQPDGTRKITISKHHKKEKIEPDSGTAASGSRLSGPIALSGRKKDIASEQQPVDDESDFSQNPGNTVTGQTTVLDKQTTGKQANAVQAGLSQNNGHRGEYSSDRDSTASFGQGEHSQTVNQEIVQVIELDGASADTVQGEETVRSVTGGTGAVIPGSGRGDIDGQDGGGESNKKKHSGLFILIPILLSAVLAGAVCIYGYFQCWFGHEWQTESCAEPAVCSRCGVRDAGVKEHVWVDATCTTPKTCKVCDTVEGKALGHLFSDASCTEVSVCSRCGRKGDSPAGHDLVEATCTEAAICKKCNQVVGEPLGHDSTAATCTEPGICRRCLAETNSALGHDWSAASCEEAGVCSRCGISSGVVLGHDFGTADCTTDGTCARCGFVRKAAGHDFAPATCSTPKTCTVCGETSGAALGHSYRNATCTEGKECSRCGDISGAPLGHSYVDATCTTAKKCTRCGATTGSALGHSYADATCTTAKKCTRCGVTSGSALGHLWEEATYTKPKTCSRCGIENGEVKGYVEYLSGDWGVVTELHRFNVYPWVLSGTAKNCTQFTLHYQITNVSYGNPYGAYRMYIKTTSGTWEEIGSFNVPDQKEVVKTFTFSTPKDIVALAVCPEANGQSVRWSDILWFEKWYLRD